MCLLCTLGFADDAFDILKSVRVDPLDRVTLSSRIRNATRTLRRACGRSQTDLAVFIIEATSAVRPNPIFGCIGDRLLVEFTRVEMRFRSWRSLWLRRECRVNLRVVSLTLLPLRSPR